MRSCCCAGSPGAWPVVRSPAREGPHPGRGSLRGRADVRAGRISRRCSSSGSKRRVGDAPSSSSRRVTRFSVSSARSSGVRQRFSVGSRAPEAARLQIGLAAGSPPSSSHASKRSNAWGVGSSGVSWRGDEGTPDPDFTRRRCERPRRMSSMRPSRTSTVCHRQPVRVVQSKPTRSSSISTVPRRARRTVRRPDDQAAEGQGANRETAPTASAPIARPPIPCAFDGLGPDRLRADGARAHRGCRHLWSKADVLPCVSSWGTTLPRFRIVVDIDS